MENTSIGEIIKSLRESRGMTQNDLCDILKIDQSTLANYENSRRLPKYDILLSVADYFNISLDYLLGRGKVYDIDPATNELMDMTNKNIQKLQKK